MTNLLNYNVGVYGGLAIMIVMFYFHFIRPVYKAYLRTKRLKRMVEKSIGREK